MEFRFPLAAFEEGNGSSAVAFPRLGSSLDVERLAERFAHAEALGRALGRRRERDGPLRVLQGQCGLCAEGVDSDQERLVARLLRQPASLCQFRGHPSPISSRRNPSRNSQV